MNQRTICILLAVFIVLASIAAYPRWISYLKKPSAGSVEIDFSQFTEDSIEKFSIKKDEDEKVFTKEGGRWLVNEFDASEKEVKSFFDSLAACEEKSLASKNPENHTNFEATEEKGYVLTINDQTSIIGRSGPDYNSFYAKKKDSPNVYLLSGSLRTKLAQDLTAWRDKVLVDISGKTIQKIEIVSKTSPLTITKTEEGKWRGESGGKTSELDEETANKLLAALSPLEATGFLDGKETGEFQSARNKTTLKIYTAGGEKLAEIPLLEKDSFYWAQPSDRDIFYKLPSSKLSDILLAHKEIFK